MVGAAGARVLAILTRAPSSGGKSRLFAALGRPPDPDLLAALLLDTIEATAAPEWLQVVMVEPADRCAEVQAIVPAGVTVRPQTGGTLGTRMSAALANLLASGARQVALIGSDLPDLPRARIGEAFTALDRDPHAIVLGPADDGGYYLVGASAPPPIFDDIDWGTPDALAQTLQAAERARLRVRLLEPWRDVDTVDDLRRSPAPRVQLWLKLDRAALMGGPHPDDM